jgi:DNA-directed RNA polymerase II subunit RPB2
MPEIIMNPHSLFGRKTISQNLNTLAGLAMAAKPDCDRDGGNHDRCRSHGTMCSEWPFEAIRERLRACGLHPAGQAVMRDPYNGRIIRGRLFMGPTPYSRAPRVAISTGRTRGLFGARCVGTNQPVKGGEDGGMKLGYMERWCLLQSGASELLQQLMHELSDSKVAWLCGRCGWLPNFREEPAEDGDVRHNKYVPECKTCGKSADIQLVNMGGTVLWLHQTLATIGIAMRMFPEGQFELDQQSSKGRLINIRHSLASQFTSDQIKRLQREQHSHKS